MKKLEKLTLKELESSTLVLSSEEEQRSIVAGSSGGYWITGDDDSQYYVESDDVVVTAPKLVQVGDTYIPASLINFNPPVDQGSIGGPTPEQQYSQACAEGYTDAAKVLLALAWGAACVAFTYAYPMFPDTGSLITSYTNFQE